MNQKHKKHGVGGEHTKAQHNQIAHTSGKEKNLKFSQRKKTLCRKEQR